MVHTEPALIDAFAQRGIDIEVLVDSDLNVTDFSDIVFNVADGLLTKSGLTAEAAEGGGIVVPVAITAADMDIPPMVYTWEVAATVAGETRTLAHGTLRVDPEPTTLPAAT